jgi:hypothetical protein
VAPSEFRYGADAPEWARGKTAREVLGLVEQQNNVIRTYISGTPQAEPQRPYTNQWGSSPGFQQQPPQPQTPAYDPDAYLQRRDIESMAPRMMQEYMAPELNYAIEIGAQNALATVQRDNAAIFQKYGPEVNLKLANVPKKLWTVDNLRTVVNLVKADHVEELASERASRLVAEMEPTLRSNGSPSSPVATQEPKYTLQSEAIPQDWKDRAAKAGLTENAIDEFCRANEITREQFFSQFGTTAITEARR